MDYCAHVTGRSFWPVLLRDLGLESKMRFSPHVANSKSFLYKTCHGAGHAAFLLAATRTLGWPKYNPEMWLPPRPILLIDPDVFHRFVLATCARAPTASHADACASGAYHSYFSWSAPRFGGVIPWYTPCADAPFGFANVCFVMLRLVSDNLRNVPATEDARRCDHGEDQACVCLRPRTPADQKRLGAVRPLPFERRPPALVRERIRRRDFRKHVPAKHAEGFLRTARSVERRLCAPKPRLLQFVRRLSRLTTRILGAGMVFDSGASTHQHSGKHLYDMHSPLFYNRAMARQRLGARTSTPAPSTPKSPGCDVRGQRFARTRSIIYSSSLSARTPPPGIIKQPLAGPSNFGTSSSGRGYTTKHLILTLETFQLLSGWLNDSASININDIFVTSSLAAD